MPPAPLTSYAEVLNALHDPGLHPEGPDTTELREKTIAALSPENLAKWQAGFREAAARFPPGNSIEAVSEIIEPYCTAAANSVTNLYSDEAVHTALARTLAAILANGWLALVEHPDPQELLNREPSLIPKAIEEILRLAAVPREIYRTAESPADDRLTLDIAAANRDPAVFTDPGRFDVHRRAPAHLAFGHGPHACVGAALIRLAATVATEAFIRLYPNARLDGPVQWTTRTQFRYASAFRIKCGAK